MTQPDPIQLDLDPSGYLQGIGQADQATEGLVGTLTQATNSMRPLQRAMDLITPSRAAIAGFTGLAAAAAGVQQQMSTMAATARITGANMGVLSAGMRSLARDIPLGNAGARQLVQQLTQLGVVTQGSEVSVGRLAKTFGQLSGATGEGAAGLASGFIQLNRVMGTGFNPERMGKLADSLTVVSAKSGASATGILQFSKSIAPLAQASGIGETKVLGISAAFAKLGDDGLGAGNAFNKMLGDMNRSIREGSPDMAAYAQIVGKTTNQFMALTKANPGEAMAQVFEGLNRAGPNAPRLLEQLGLDGVRTQRYIQSVSAAGGIRSAMNDAVSGYGSGSTAEAAAKAFNGLTDAGTRLRSVTEQLVDAMGAPLLGAMTKFTDLLGAGVSPVAQAVGSRPAQDLMKAAVYAAIPLMAAMKLGGPLGTMALGTQALTSSVVQGGLAGFRRGRDPLTEGGRFTGGFLARHDAGMTLADSEFFDRASRGTFGLGRRIGGLMPGGGAGPGMFTQARNLGFAGVGAMMRMQAEQFRAARTAAPFRDYVMRPYGQPYEDYAMTRGGVRQAVREGSLSEQEGRSTVAAARRDLINEVRSQGLGTGLRQLATGGLAMGVEGARFGIGGALRLGGMAAGALATPGALLTAGTVGYEVYSHQQQLKRAADEQSANNTSFIDDYRVAMGKATEATSTFAGRLQATAESMAAGVTKMSDALKVSPEDVKAASGVSGHAVMKFAGSPAGVAAQLRIQRPAPDELARIKYDLINQYGARGAQDILDQVGTGSGGVGDFEAAARGLAQDKGAGGFRGFASRRLDIVGGLQHLRAGQGANRSFDYTVSGLSSAQVKGADTLGTAIRQQAADSAQKYGANYANSQAREDMDRSIQAALDAGNSDLAAALVHSFETNFAPGQATWKMNTNELQQRGFSAIMDQHSTAFRQNFGIDPNQPLGMQIQHGYYDTHSQGSGLQALFGGTGAGYAGARAAVNTALTTGIESPAAQQQAIAEVAKAYQAAGGSLEGLADHAAALASMFDNAKDGGNRFAMALNQYAMQALANRPQVVSQGSMASTMADRYARLAKINPTNENDEQLRQQGVQGLQTLQEQTKQAVVTRLNTQREYQVQTKRNADDFNEQMRYSEEDYNRSVLRNEHDFNRQRSIANRDYARNALHAEQDFQRQRQYMIEDGARAAYSAYQRIAVQQTWDAPNLIGNITEQAQALQAQLDNLTKARHEGVTSNAIKLLGLNDPSNAQQLASLVGDMANDPSVVKALDSAAASRQKLGERLVGDPDNTQLARSDKEFHLSMARAREQFGITMGDMATSYQQAVNRATEDRNIAVGRMNAQNTKMVKRAADDLTRADQEIVGSLEKLSAALHSAVSGQLVDFTNLTASSMDEWAKLATQFAGNWKNLVGGLNVNAVFTLTDAMGNPIDATSGVGAPDVAVSPSHTGKPQPTTSGTGTAGIDSLYGSLTAGGGSGLSGYETLPGGKRVTQHALGGIFTHAGQLDVAGEQGSEALIPLNRGGAAVLAEAMHQFISRDQARMMSTGSAATHVHYDSSTHYADHSQTIEHVTVISQDPDEMGHKLMAKRRRSNLTAPPQTR